MSTGFLGRGLHSGIWVLEANFGAVLEAPPGGNRDELVWSVPGKAGEGPGSRRKEGLQEKFCSWSPLFHSHSIGSLGCLLMTSAGQGQCLTFSPFLSAPLPGFGGWGAFHLLLPPRRGPTSVLPFLSLSWVSVLFTFYPPG